MSETIEASVEVEVYCDECGAELDIEGIGDKRGTKGTRVRPCDCVSKKEVEEQAEIIAEMRERMSELEYAIAEATETP